MFAKNILFIDIGSFYIKGMVINEKKHQILAKHYVQETGISHGYITSATQFTNALYSLIKHLEKETKLVLKKVVLIINGKIINYKMLTSTPMQINSVIDEKKIAIIENKINKWVREKKSLLIEHKPISYKIDNIKVVEPIGLFAEQFNFVYFLAYSKSNLLGNIIYIIEQMNLDVINIFPSIYCNGEYLTQDERNLGSLIFDIGASSINWACFYENNPISAGSINIGSELITKKLATALKISLNEARNIKEQHIHSQLLPEHFCAWVEFNKGNSSEFILQSEIIRKIMPEIDTLVSEIYKIIETFKKKSHISVLCGSGSWLNGLAQAVEKKANSTVKLIPSSEPMMDSLNAALKYYKSYNSQEKTIFHNALTWLKNNI